MLETFRRQSVADRTQAIQRLRAIWTQLDPEAEAKVAHIHRQKALRRLKRISFGDGLANEAAAHCIRELAREIDQLNIRITALENDLGRLLNEHGNPVADLPGAGPAVAAAVIAHAGDVRRYKSPAAFARFCGRRADPMRLRPDRRTPPPASRRQPPDERRAAPDRRRPSPSPPRRPRLPQPQTR
nr:transposase [Solirubrobacter soli]